MAFLTNQEWFPQIKKRKMLKSRKEKQIVHLSLRVFSRTVQLQLLKSFTNRNFEKNITNFYFELLIICLIN